MLLQKMNRSPTKKPGQGLKLLALCCRRLLQQPRPNVSLVSLMFNGLLQKLPIPIARPGQDLKLLSHY